MGRVSDHGVTVRYADPFETPLEEGFKLVHLLFLKQRQRPVIYIGDGASDVAPPQWQTSLSREAPLRSFVAPGQFLTSGSMISMTSCVS